MCLKAVTCFSIKQKPICCCPNQFETFMFMSQGAVDIGSGNLGYGYGYFNATIKTAFDGVNQLTYTHKHAMNFMSIWPMPFVLDTIMIYDYKNVSMIFLSSLVGFFYNTLQFVTLYEDTCIVYNFEI